MVDDDEMCILPMDNNDNDTARIVYILLGICYIHDNGYSASSRLAHLSLLRIDTYIVHIYELY